MGLEVWQEMPVAPSLRGVRPHFCLGAVAQAVEAGAVPAIISVATTPNLPDKHLESLLAGAPPPCGGTPPTFDPSEALCVCLH